MKIKAILFGISVFFPAIVFAGSATCPLSSGINVHTAKRVLHICKQGSVVKTFSIALGYQGIGKKRAGDNKTPIGLYSLAYPRKSTQFKMFIPIGYPTSRQRAKGYTGRDVGIHGPTQSSSLLRFLGNMPKSTRGCIAVGSNHHIDYVAHWVKTHPGTQVLII